MPDIETINLKAEIQNLKNEIIKWVFVIYSVQTVVIISVLKFFHYH